MLRNPAPLTREHYCYTSLQTYDTNKRYDPLKAHEVYGYPSTEGVLIKGVCAVELLHLNPDKFKRPTDPQTLRKRTSFVRDFEV
jgi:hypothetical protein